ncbi:hypothetical protein EDB89DRAFT_1907748 [Lactarius sanguifluus]|nr:hypothetical protein EDB89DRAFT_1907748 [Lactarius sanguifluus]
MHSSLANQYSAPAFGRLSSFAPFVSGKVCTVGATRIATSAGACPEHVPWLCPDTHLATVGAPISHGSTPSDNHGFLPLPTPILRNSRNSLSLGYFYGITRNNPEEHDGLSSLGLLGPLLQEHC